MPLSGTVPNYDIGTSADQSTTLASASGAVFPSSGQAIAAASNEALGASFVRYVGLLGACSGGSTASGVNFPAAAASGLAQMQRELAMRAADLQGPGQGNAGRLAFANTLLAASGEVQWIS